MTEYLTRNEWICRYNEGSLHGRELELFNAMIRSDKSLRQEVFLDKKLDEMLADSDLLKFRKIMVKASSNGWKKRAGSMLLIAASVAFLLTGCALCIFLLTRTRVSHEISKNETVNNKYNSSDGNAARMDTAHMKGINLKDAVKRPDGNTVIAAADVPLPYLERICGEALRGSHFRLLSPLPGTVIGKDRLISFEWETTIKSGFSLEIIDNRGKVQTTCEVSAETPLILDAGALSPGLYYWKLLDHDNLVFVGKFTLE